MSSQPTADDLKATLRSASLRVTAQRVAVMEALAGHPHSDARLLAAQVRRTLGSVSVQAVYDVLASLGAAGLIRKIEPAGSHALYELSGRGNHHHVVCRICGALADVDCVVGSAPCLTPSCTHGFVVDEAEVIFWGQCPSCAATSH